MLKQFLRVLAVATLLAGPIANDAALAATDAPGGAHATTGAAGGHEKGEIMPDATKASSILQALWVIIIFLIMLAILYPTAWKNVLAGLKAREQRIRTDIAEAEAARTRAEAI